MYNLVEICSPIYLMGVLGPSVSESAAIWRFIDTCGRDYTINRLVGYLTVHVHLELIVRVACTP